ncbi:MAG: helix-turn-helix domain-containing protein [Candidatus Magasanikbacteria bacterium]
MLIKDLQKLGFTKNLSTVYLTLFELGEAKAGELVRRTGMHRNLVYTALDLLEEKKLVSKNTKRGVAVYVALDPARIMGEVEEKKKLAEDIIEELLAKHRVSSQEVIVYEGKEEIQKKYLELYSTLAKDDYWYVLGLSPNFFEINGKKNIDLFAKLQVEHGIHMKGVSGYLDEKESTYIKETEGLTEFKLIPDIARKDSEINIIKDRVLIFIFTEPYTIIEIFNHDLVESYKEYFEFLWEDKSQNLRGEKGIRIFLEDIGTVDKVYWIGGSKDSMDVYFPEEAQKCKEVRRKKGIEWHDLVDAGADLSGTESHSSIRNEPGYFYKYLPESVSSPHVICIYGNKVANIIWKDGGYVNIIENEEMAKGYLNYFDYLWNQEVQTLTGWKNVEGLFNKTVLDDLISDGGAEYVIGAGYGKPGDEEVKKRVDDLFLYHNKFLIEHKIHKHIILYEKHREYFEKQVSSVGDPTFQYIHTKYLPDTYENPVEIHIFKNKATITYFGPKAFSTVYENPNIISGFRKQFDMLWSIAKE